jgi:hypothetical protein
MLSIACGTIIRYLTGVIASNNQRHLLDFTPKKLSEGM